MNLPMKSIVRGWVLLMTAFAQAAEFHVAPKGRDQNDGSAAAPLATVQAGVNKLQPGDT